jgi:hypothetical protein
MLFTEYEKVKFQNQTNLDFDTALLEVHKISCTEPDRQFGGCSSFFKSLNPDAEIPF